MLKNAMPARKRYKNCLPIRDELLPAAGKLLKCGMPLAAIACCINILAPPTASPGNKNQIKSFYKQRF